MRRETLITIAIILTLVALILAFKPLSYICSKGTDEFVIIGTICFSLISYIYKHIYHPGKISSPLTIITGRPRASIATLYSLLPLSNS